MSGPDIFRMQSAAMRLLLYAQGFRRAYGFLEANPPSRAGTARHLAGLVHQGVLTPEAGTLRLQEPWRTWVPCIGQARRVVQLEGPSLQSAVCAYPLKGGALLCSPLARSPQTLRFCAAGREDLWGKMDALCALPPQDAVPVEPATGDWAEERPGEELFSMRAIVLPEGVEEDRRSVVQMPLYKAQLSRAWGGWEASSYEEKAMAALLLHWLEESV